ncbi:MAG: DUF6779 domain-containing protein [Jatrophihabitantaceae bacterium]
MPPHSVGNQPPRLRKTSVLRGFGFFLAVVLGAIAIWLIVTSTSQKRIEIGVLAGLWGLLLGAFSVFGSRHPLRTEAAAAAGHDVALRGAAELERADDAAARRNFEARLEHLLRREIQTSMAREVSSLREEVSSLRTELLDKVGGQLRLERIETTRVIGSDIEAIKREVNQLKGARLFGEPGPSSAPVTRITSSRVLETETTGSGTERVSETVHEVRPARNFKTVAASGPPQIQLAATGAPQIHDAEVVEEPATGVLARPSAPPVAAATQSPVPVAPTPPPAAATSPPAVQTPPPVQPAPEPELINDTFAGLPRLRPFTDFELDPIEPTPDPPSAYSGRRRVDDPPRSGSARHGSGEDESASGGHRRSRVADEGDDVLSRILQRENAR